jgi:hypothetical protein
MSLLSPSFSLLHSSLLSHSFSVFLVCF